MTMIMVILIQTIFTIKHTKLYVLLLILSAKDHEKLSRLLINGFERSVYRNKDKTKSGNKNTANRYRYFLDSNFQGLSRLFVSICSNQDCNDK